MRIHILGICGTFMGGLALLARAAGHQVSGSDADVYPPMSDQLRDAGIAVGEGYDPRHLQPEPDCVVIGNALSRGNPAVEHVLDRGLPYTSGPQWLAENLLAQRWVLGVAGTHGKTTTAAMLAWILEEAGLDPGFLIGGVPLDFGCSARPGQAPFFVVEADEYDTAFFDKRSKFVHYRPRTAILNNLEFDHADIFPDLAAIQRQFHHLVRIVPGNGLLVAPAADPNLDAVLAQGCWTPVERVAATAGVVALGWSASDLAPGETAFTVHCDGRQLGRVNWAHSGRHNVANALAALAAARHAGVPPGLGIAALCRFQGVKRRLELRGTAAGVAVYDDFAHHPTAIATTLAGLRGRVGAARIAAILEPRSNTMRLGHHAASLAPSLAGADRVLLFRPADLGWDLDPVRTALGPQASVHATLDGLVAALCAWAREGDQVVVMSNGGFGGIHARLLAALQQRGGTG
jgi:UDP-N-acetylmuramate: L-alanyl-gamma-D-glutamyl-meso-diaminopimelate ligase